ncbi:MAG TPA: DUF58 domain-containing protein [Streptosporangiaceae bacterium]|nr:DUF58 domain-containing protein [Streptosporangiaceae bacterium]
MSHNEGGHTAAATELRLQWRLSRHARRLLTLGLAAALAATLARRPEFTGIAAIALLPLAAGRISRPAAMTVRVRPSSRRVFEGEQVAISASCSGADGWSVRWTLVPGDGLNNAGPTFRDGDSVRLLAAAEHWGRRRMGAVEVTLRDRWRLFEGHAEHVLPTVDCYPHPAAQRTRVVLSRLPNRLGEHVARTPGEGTEFAGVRDYVPGDRQRSINWAASTRRGRLQVNMFAGERSQDVVLVVDATSDVGEPGTSALDLALRGAAAAAHAYLDARDRVGVIAYQWGGVAWRPPGLGKRQVYRIIDTMLSASPYASDGGEVARGGSFRRMPRAALPPGSLVVVFSPLLDQRFIETLRELRERGFTILVIDVLNATPPSRPRLADKLARRLWTMEQEAIRFSLRELGVPVTHWDGTQPLDLPLAGYSRRPLVPLGGRR